MLCAMVHTNSPSIQEAEPGRLLWVQSQAGLQTEAVAKEPKHQQFFECSHPSQSTHFGMGLEERTQPQTEQHMD